MQTYLVEHYRPGLTSAALRHSAEQIRRAADALEREGTSVRYLRSTIVPSDEAFLSLLEADSEAIVHETYVRAGLSFDRISEAISA